MYDIAIIGSGPGGYVGAIRASQLGAKVALIEKESVGGTCLNWGCIPTKVILASADKYNEAKKFDKFGISIENLSIDYKKVFERKNTIVEKLRKSLNQLIKSYGIDIYSAEAEIISPNALQLNDNRIEFKKLILATGSRTGSLPGINVDHQFVLDTNDILSLDTLPEKTVIVGSGASGIEWARVLSSFGKEVTLIELADRLAPMSDISQSERLERLFKKSKIKFFKSTKVIKAENNKVMLDNGEALDTDIVLLATGRVPNTDIKGIELLNLEKNGRFFEVDEIFKTTNENVYAIGDVNGILPLAHTASHQAIVSVEHILKNTIGTTDYNAIPRVIYGYPEVASVGFTEQQLKDQPYKTALFPISAVGKSIVDDDIDGFVKVLANEDQILGVHAICKHAGDIIQQAAIAIANNISLSEMQHTVFAHPTQSESLLEAFLAVDDIALHIPPIKK